LRLNLATYAIREPGEFHAAFARMAKARVEAIVVQDDTLFGEANAGAIAGPAARQGIVSVGGIGFANTGGAFGLGRSDTDLYRRGANFVDRILRGEKPSDMPIEQATRFELVINRNTVRALGIKVPQSILLRADRMIE
jgi:putative ABC transport system substrate-binding protein